MKYYKKSNIIILVVFVSFVWLLIWNAKQKVLIAPKEDIVSTKKAIAQFVLKTKSLPKDFNDLIDYGFLKKINTDDASYYGVYVYSKDENIINANKPSHFLTTINLSKIKINYVDDPKKIRIENSHLYDDKNNKFLIIEWLGDENLQEECEKSSAELFDILNRSAQYQSDTNEIEKAKHQLKDEEK